MTYVCEFRAERRQFPPEYAPDSRNSTLMKLMQSEEITLYLLTVGCNTSVDAVLEPDEIFRKLVRPQWNLKV